MRAGSHSSGVSDFREQAWSPRFRSGLEIIRGKRADFDSSFTGAYMFFICIMYGYDALVGSVVISIEQFREDFGLPFFPE